MQIVAIHLANIKLMKCQERSNINSPPLRAGLGWNRKANGYLIMSQTTQSRSR